MNCENCGATLRVLSGQRLLACDHCGTVCRLPDADIVDENLVFLNDTTRQSCPVCDVPLYAAALDTFAVSACRQCRGVLLTSDNFAQVVRVRREDYEGARQEHTPIDPVELQREVKCPACRRRMETHPYYGPGGVAIDSCGACRLVWIDRGEISVIERAEGRV